MLYSHFIACYTLLFPATGNQRIAPLSPCRFISQEPVPQQQVQPQNKGQRLPGLDGFWPPECWGVWILFVISNHPITIFKEPINQPTMCTERSILSLIPASHGIVGVPLLHLISVVNLYNEDDAINIWICMCNSYGFYMHLHFWGNMTGNAFCFIYFLAYLILFLH